MRSRKTCCVVVLAALALGRFVGGVGAAEPAKTDVAKWYEQDKSRLPKCQVAPEIRAAYPDIDATLAALKYALANDQLWDGVTWKIDEDLAVIRKGEIEALDDPKMTFGWKPDQTPLKQIKKGSSFNDARTWSGTLVNLAEHAFLNGNDTDPITPRPPAEVMRTLSHELGHVWDDRAHFVSKYAIEPGGQGLCYEFQKLVPSDPFSPEAIRELNRVLGKPEPEDPNAGKDVVDTNEEENPNKFYIYAINTSGLSLYVGRPDEMKNLKSGRGLADSGLEVGPVKFEKLHSKGYPTKEDAITHLKEVVAKGKDSHWTGQWVKYNGGEYRQVHTGNLLTK